MRIDMKQLFFSLCLITMFASCDKVDSPYIEEPQPPGDGVTFIGTQITDSVVDPVGASGSAVQNILLEDYTGFKCTNCPDAHAVSDDLIDLYGDQLSVISIHCTEAFAEPDPGAVFPEPFSQDFRTEAGETYVDQFGIFALPTGIVNRGKYDGFFPVAFEAWEAAVEELSTMTSPVKMEVQNVSFANDTLDIDCTFEFLEDLEEHS